MLNKIIHIDHVKRWYLYVVGTYVLGLSLAIGNHFFFAYLDNKNVILYDQFWITVAKNAWARAAQVCFIVSSHTAFLGMIWSTISGLPLPVRMVDSVLRLPSFLPLLNILFSSKIKRLHNLIFYSVSLLSLAFVPITIPAALLVRPSKPIPTQLQVPNIDMSIDPRLYTVIISGWEYVGPSNHLQRLVRNMLTSDTVSTWNAPGGCPYGCSYEVSYYAPVLSCVDYVPNPSDLASNASYRASFNISDSFLALNMTFWPMENGTYVGGNSSSPSGTRCTFHNGRYVAAMEYWGSQRYASIANYTRTTDDPIIGTSLGFSNSSDCPRNTSWVISDPSSTSPCARMQMNTWALTDAFATALSGTIVTHSQSGTLGPEERAVNSALMPNLDYLFSVHEIYQSFDLSPWAKQIGLGRALETLFANATLSLTRDAYIHDWKSEAQNALVVPFANKFSYNRKSFWIGYGGAFLTVLGVMLASWDIRGSLPTEETRLGRILATTRDESFEQLQDQKEGIDDLVICYESVQKDGGHVLAFTVKTEESGLRKRKLDTEEIGLLERTTSVP
ncbi:unnamed protein product [Rhizoctonia solani]|uniref:Uncharacterized protein n=1 Tax=Rhizoctonia solani TaxID=456999 RepID=A0A8H3EB72_9AGAM|nr:unnamed protein product [Rhizoctonia solani]